MSLAERLAARRRRRRNEGDEGDQVPLSPARAHGGFRDSEDVDAGRPGVEDLGTAGGEGDGRVDSPPRRRGGRRRGGRARFGEPEDLRTPARRSPADANTSGIGALSERARASQRQRRRRRFGESEEGWVAQRESVDAVAESGSAASGGDTDAGEESAAAGGGEDVAPSASEDDASSASAAEQSEAEAGAGAGAGSGAEAAAGEAAEAVEEGEKEEEEEEEEEEELLLAHPGGAAPRVAAPRRLWAHPAAATDLGLGTVECGGAAAEAGRDPHWVGLRVEAAAAEASAARMGLAVEPAADLPPGTEAALFVRLHRDAAAGEKGAAAGEEAANAGADRVRGAARRRARRGRRGRDSPDDSAAEESDIGSEGTDGTGGTDAPKTPPTSSVAGEPGAGADAVGGAVAGGGLRQRALTTGGRVRTAAASTVAGSALPAGAVLGKRSLRARDVRVRRDAVVTVGGRVVGEGNAARLDVCFRGADLASHPLLSEEEAAATLLWRAHGVYRDLVCGGEAEAEARRARGLLAEVAEVQSGMGPGEVRAAADEVADVGMSAVASSVGGRRFGGGRSATGTGVAGTSEAGSGLGGTLTREAAAAARRRALVALWARALDALSRAVEAEGRARQAAAEVQTLWRRVKAARAAAGHASTAVRLRARRVAAPRGEGWIAGAEKLFDAAAAVVAASGGDGRRDAAARRRSRLLARARRRVAAWAEAGPPPALRLDTDHPVTPPDHPSVPATERRRRTKLAGLHLRLTVHCGAHRVTTVDLGALGHGQGALRWARRRLLRVVLWERPATLRVTAALSAGLRTTTCVPVDVSVPGSDRPQVSVHTVPATDTTFRATASPAAPSPPLPAPGAAGAVVAAVTPLHGSVAGRATSQTAPGCLSVLSRGGGGGAARAPASTGWTAAAGGRIAVDVRVAMRWAGVLGNEPRDISERTPTSARPSRGAAGEGRASTAGAAAAAGATGAEKSRVAGGQASSLLAMAETRAALPPLARDTGAGGGGGGGAAAASDMGWLAWLRWLGERWLVGAAGEEAAERATAFARERDFQTLVSSGAALVDALDPRDGAMARMAEALAGQDARGDVYEPLGRRRRATFLLPEEFRLREPWRFKVLRARRAAAGTGVSVAGAGVPVPSLEGEVGTSEAMRAWIARAMEAERDAERAVIAARRGVETGSDVRSVVAEEEEEDEGGDWRAAFGRGKSRREAATRGASLLERVHAAQAKMRVTGPRPIALGEVVREGLLPEYFQAGFDPTALLALLAPRRRLRPRAQPAVVATALAESCDIVVQVVRAANVPRRATGVGAGPGSPRFGRAGGRRRRQRGRDRGSGRRRRQSRDGRSDASGESGSDEDGDQGPSVSFVEVSFQGATDRTSAQAGDSPAWQQQLRVPVRPPADGYSPFALTQMREEMRVSLFDERPPVRSLEALTVRRRRRGELPQDRPEKRFLGSLAIPFTTVYLTGKVEGTFRLDAPDVMMGYRQPESRTAPGTLAAGALVGDAAPSAVAGAGAPGPGSGGTYVHLVATLQPGLPPPPEAEAAEEEASLGELMLSEGEEEAVRKHAVGYLRKLRKHKTWAGRSVDVLVPTVQGTRALALRYLRAQEPPPDPTADNAAPMQTHRKAARFVSLVPFVEDFQAFGGDRDVWSTTDEFLKLLCGDWEEHAVLLRNFFHWIDGDAARSGWRSLIVMGRAIPEGDTVYVLRMRAGMSATEAVAPRDAWFWNAATGRCYNARDPNIPLREVHAVMDDTNCWANIQRAAAPDQVSFALDNARHWSPLFPAGHPWRPDPTQMVNRERPAYSTPDPESVAMLATTLRSRIEGEIRQWRNDNATFIFDPAHLRKLSQVLQMLEVDRLDGGDDGEDDASRTLQDLTESLNAEECFGFPLCLPYTDEDELVAAVRTTGVHDTAMPDVRFALAVEVFPYACGVLAVWVYIGAIVPKSFDR